MKNVCLIIVTYNRKEILLKNLNCVLNQTFLPKKIVVVDNNSEDDTYSYISINYPSIELLKLNENLGFAAGLAAGLEKNIDEDFDFFWLMDDDSFPNETFLEKQLEVSNNLEFGILGSYGVKHNYFNQEKVIKGPIQEVDFVLVDCALVKAEVVRKIGFPNPKIFMMCEDLEYCKRIKKSGYKIVCFPNTSINRLHLGSKTNSFSLKWRAYYHSRNHLFILLNFFNFKSLIYFLSMQSKFFVSTLINFKFDIFKLRFIGIYHGLIGKMGKTLNPKTLKFK